MICVAITYLIVIAIQNYKIKSCLLVRGTSCLLSNPIVHFNESFPEHLIPECLTGNN